MSNFASPDDKTWEYETLRRKEKIPEHLNITRLPATMPNNNQVTQETEKIRRLSNDIIWGC